MIFWEILLIDIPGLRMKKLLITSIVVFANTVFFSAANAGGSHGAEDIAAEDFVRVRSTRLSYNIDHDTCKVTLKTTRNVRRITQRDPNGNIIKRWSTRSGERVRLFNDFSKFADGLTEGTLKVKTGYKNRVKFQEIGDQFRADLIDCFTKDVDPVEPPTEPEVTCPAVVVDAVNSLVSDANGDSEADAQPVSVGRTANSCTLFFGDALTNPGGISVVGIFNGESAENGFGAGAAINGEAAPVDEFGNPVSLSPEQLGACVVAIGASEPIMANLIMTDLIGDESLDLGNLCAGFVPNP